MTTTSTEIEIRQAAPIPHHGGPSAAVSRASLPERLQYAKALAQAGLLPRAYQQNPANVLIAMEKGEAIGIHHMTAMESVHVINGKATLSAELMRALIVRAGHQFDVTVITREKAVVECARRERPDRVFTIEFTEEDAKEAGLLAGPNKDNWRKYRKQMLVARVTSFAARTHFSDVLAGMVYVPEELGAIVDESGEPVDVTPTATIHPIGPTPATEPDADPAVVADLRNRIATADIDGLRDLWRAVSGAEETAALPAATIHELQIQILDRKEDLSPADEKTLQRLHIALGEHGIADRDDKLIALIRITGRTDLNSSKELTRAEAISAIDVIKDTPAGVDLLTGAVIPDGAGVNPADYATAETEAAAEVDEAMTWDGAA